MARRYRSDAANRIRMVGSASSGSPVFVKVMGYRPLCRGATTEEASGTCFSRSVMTLQMLGDGAVERMPRALGPASNALGCFVDHILLPEPPMCKQSCWVSGSERMEMVLKQSIRNGIESVALDGKQYRDSTTRSITQHAEEGTYVVDAHAQEWCPSRVLCGKLTDH